MAKRRLLSAPRLLLHLSPPHWRHALLPQAHFLHSMRSANDRHPGSRFKTAALGPRCHFHKRHVQLRPRSFQRRRPPHRPTLVWSVIILSKPVTSSHLLSRQTQKRTSRNQLLNKYRSVVLAHLGRTHSQVESTDVDTKHASVFIALVHRDPAASGEVLCQRQRCFKWETQGRFY